MEYAIITVSPTWDKNTLIGFSSDAYKQWHEQIEPGTRVLIYKPNPINAIVAEGVIPDNTFIKMDDVSDENSNHVMTDQGELADYGLPIKVLYSYPETTIISQTSLKEIINSKNIRLSNWTPIDDVTYRALSSFPN